MQRKLITIFGGTGFLGRYVVQELARAGYSLRIVCRHPQRGNFLQPLSGVGQSVVVRGDISRLDSLAPLVADSFAVINLVGKLYESGKKQSFRRIHVEAASRLAEEAHKAGAQHFVHLSALGVERSDACYARTKLEGEEAVKRAFPDAVILRPSVLFGPEDNFFNQFARLAGISPVLPLIGGGKTRFQPAYVADVACALREVIQRGIHGQTFELGGPGVYSFKEILRFILDTIGKERRLVSVPFWLAKMKGSVLSLLPKPPLTRDQVRLLQTDNVLTGALPGFEALGVQPRPVELIVPQYLLAQRRKGQNTGAEGKTGALPVAPSL